MHFDNLLGMKVGGSAGPLEEQWIKQTVNKHETVWIGKSITYEI